LVPPLIGDTPTPRPTTIRVEGLSSSMISVELRGPDDPPPEVAAAGHDRCVIPIKPEYVDAWLNPDPANLKALYAILDDRERPYYEHRLAA